MSYNKVVETDCKAFLTRVLPEGYSENQERSMRLAFFAGYKCSLMMFKTVAIEEDEAVGSMVLDMVEKEIDGYFQGVKAQAAAERAAAEGSADAGS